MSGIKSEREPKSYLYSCILSVTRKQKARQDVHQDSNARQMLDLVAKYFMKKDSPNAKPTARLFSKMTESNENQMRCYAPCTPL